MKICAVIPAAGNGTRLGSEHPKVFTEVYNGKVVWDILYQNIRPYVDGFNLVLKPNVAEKYSRYISDDVFISEQDKALGMGDAIFRGKDFWSRYDYILVVWGDQVNLSSPTLKDVTSSTNGDVVIPLVTPEDPYVEYVFNEGKLIKVLQSREGDETSTNGFSDIGVFLLPTKNLVKFWEEFCLKSEKGNTTGELNFLPFFVYLNNFCNLPIKKILVKDVDEAKGLNTKEDLIFFQNKMNIKFLE